jgi:hypothetical protein
MGSMDAGATITFCAMDMGTGRFRGLKHPSITAGHAHPDRL